MDEFSFSEVFGRIQNASDIKKLTQLADFIGISPQAVSKTKKKGTFPTDWAVALERKYGLLTMWILTGEGPMKHNQEDKKKPTVTSATEALPTYLRDLAEWATEMSGSESQAWLQKQLDICLPTFKMWREQKNEAAALHQNQIAERKIA